MRLATTTSDFFKYGLNVEESIMAILEAGFKYIDYSFDYDFTNKTGLLGENWEAYADGLLNMAKKTVFILFRHTHHWEDHF